MATEKNIKVVFTLPDGVSVTHYGAEGETVMDVAIDNGVPGIIAQCGGGCRCCTCHSWFDDAWFPKLNTPHPDELDLLEYAWGFNSNSRLTCQVKLTPALHGMLVVIPAEQS